MSDTRPGVKSIVLLNSGRFDDAQIELDTCVNLVGANNVGKTSAVTPLQFLYVGALNEMSFGGKSMEETRRYFFPHANSYIIFECLSAETGAYVCVGVRGLGAVRGHEFERFAYPGRYERAHYVDDQQQMRDADETKALIMAASGMYRVLDKASDMTALLCGQYEDRVLNLSFVPLKDAGSRAMFSRLFKNLLFLRAMSQTDLKDTLVEVYRRSLTQPVVTLRKSNEEQIRRLQAQHEQIRLFRSAAPAIKAAAGHAETMRRERVGLPDIYRRLLVLKTSEEQTWVAAADAAKAAIETLQQQRGTVEGERAKAREAFQAAVKEETNKATAVDSITQAGLEFDGFVETLEQVALDNAKAREQKLRKDIAQVEAEPLRDLRGRRSAAAEALKTARARLAGFERLLASMLAEAIGADEAARALSVLSSSIAQIDRDHVVSLDAAAFARQMREMAACVSDDGAFAGFGLVLPPGQLELQALPSKEALAAEIDQIGEALTEWDRRIALAERGQALENELTTAVAEREALDDRMRRYRDWSRRAAELPGMREDLERATSDRKAAESALTALDRRGDELGTAIADQEKVMARSASELERIRSVNPPPPPPDWPDDVLGKGEGEPLVPLAESYARSFRLAQSAERELEVAIRGLEAQLQDGLDGATPEAKLEAATQRLTGLSVELEAFDREWGSLLVAARSSIDHIIRDVQKLADEVARLNRRLSQVAISNLSGVTLRIVEQKDVMDRFRALLTDDLFAGEQNRDRALKELAELIRGQDGTITLQQLFGVQIEVRMDGEARPVTFASLDAIESNGTTIMLKLLLQMVLIGDLLKRDRAVAIPYYIDEANTLDAVNFSSVLQVSNELGFQPILAGTSPTSSAKHFYFVRYVGGRKSVMERRQRLVREPVAPATAAAQP